MARLEQTMRALRALDPVDWQTGLSPAGARLAWSEELDRVETGLAQPDAQTLVAFDTLESTGLSRAPQTLWIWCAANVFTAPLRWLVFGALSGLRVVLKAPSQAPASVQAMGRVFGVKVVVSSQQGLAAIQPGDRVLGFGGDQAMGGLELALPQSVRRSLHGHRVSFAVVRSSDQRTAKALAWDAAIFDGQGCMSPAGVFVLGDAPALAAHLASALERLSIELPRGPMDGALGPAWRRRTGLARVLGSCHEGAEWAVPVLPLDRAEALVLPRMLPVHPLLSLEQLLPLGALPLSSLALEGARPELPFTRWVAPGELQRPRFGPVHEGVDIVQLLMTY